MCRRAKNKVVSKTLFQTSIFRVLFFAVFYLWIFNFVLLIHTSYFFINDPEGEVASRGASWMHSLSVQLTPTLNSHCLTAEAFHILCEYSFPSLDSLSVPSTWGTARPTCEIRGLCLEKLFPF